MIVSMNEANSGKVSKLLLLFERNCPEAHFTKIEENIFTLST